MSIVSLELMQELFVSKTCSFGLYLSGCAFGISTLFVSEESLMCASLGANDFLLDEHLRSSIGASSLELGIVVVDARWERCRRGGFLSLSDALDFCL